MIRKSVISVTIVPIIGFVLYFCLPQNVFGQPGEGYKKIESGTYHHSGQGLLDLKFTVWGKLYKGPTILDKQDINLKIIVTHDRPNGAPSYRFRTNEGKIYTQQDIGIAPFEALVYSGNATFDIQVQYKQEIKSLSVANHDSRIVFRLPKGFNLNDAKVSMKNFRHASFDNISEVLNAIYKLEKDKKDKEDKDKAEKERLAKEKKERESQAAKESAKQATAQASEKGTAASGNKTKRSNSDFWGTDKKPTANNQKKASASPKSKNDFWNTDKPITSTGNGKGANGGSIEFGAYVAPGIWKIFMSRNLGADTGSDPLTPGQALVGKLFEKDKFNCPRGYRVPTKEEWKGLFANNKITWITGGPSGSGLMIGDNLFLPAAGFIDLDYGFNERERQKREWAAQRKAEEDRKKREDWIRRGRPNEISIGFANSEEPIKTNNPGVIQFQGDVGYYWAMDSNDRVVKSRISIHSDSNIHYFDETQYPMGYSARCIKD